MLNYGLVGLGNLGEKIARNLLKKKITLKVYDKDQEKVNKLTKIGAISSLSTADTAVNVDGLITCLPSPKISTEVMIGENGAIQKMKPGSTWIETSTTDIKDLQLVSKIAEKQNIKTIEAPVTGGVHRAEKGIITVLVGAEKKNFLEHEEAIKAFGGKIFYLGEVASQSTVRRNSILIALRRRFGSSAE